MDPKNDFYYNLRGNINFNKGRYDLAIADFTKVIERRPKSSEAYFNRCDVYVYKGLNDQAIADCAKAIEIYPEFALPYYSQALAYDRKGDTKAAVGAYKNFLKYASDQYDARVNRAKQRIEELDRNPKQ